MHAYPFSIELASSIERSIDPSRLIDRSIAIATSTSGSIEDFVHHGRHAHARRDSDRTRRHLHVYVQHTIDIESPCSCHGSDSKPPSRRHDHSESIDLVSRARALDRDRSRFATDLQLSFNFNFKLKLPCGRRPIALQSYRAQESMNMHVKTRLAQPLYHGLGIDVSS